ncbi:MAG: TadE family protein [Amylibacter sp.]
MNILHTYAQIKNGLRLAYRDESGATLVEFGIVLSVFLLLFFGLMDFGRLGFNYVNTEKAMQIAARVSAVRPPACPGVPEVHLRGAVAPGTLPPKFGTSCGSGAMVCTNPGTITCSGSAANPTANEIWTLISGALPYDAGIDNLRFSYSYDNNLGFLGGPYVPVVTVEVQNLNFQFMSPLGALVGLAAGAADPGLGADIPFPPMSVSLPAEDLALGNDG